ncbi:MAG TPA: hypothetical protein VFF16_06470 [Telluria sp.]|nr:hypothetical protein [Telluria sp.]
MQPFSTQRFIDDFVAANRSAAGGAREEYALRQALLGLVRQARVEQMAEIRITAVRLAGAEARTQALRRLRRECGPPASQRQLEFDGGEAGAA